jgi:hypothetical protein
MLFGEPDAQDPSIQLGRLDLSVLVVGLAGCLLLGLATGPLTPVLASAGRLLAGAS